MEPDVRSVLESSSLENSSPFGMHGLQTVARVLDVYDGDTVTLAVPFLGKVFACACRIKGIDTPEMKSRDPAEKARARAARARLLLYCCGETVGDSADWPRERVRSFLKDHCTFAWILCYEPDKYGRVLIDLYNDPERAQSSASEVMLREGHAYAYDGGTKLSGSMAKLEDPNA